MLYQIKTEDQTDLGEDQEEAEEKYYCRACGHLITEGGWRVAVGGSHEHNRANPGGHRFRIWLFKEASGVFAIGAPDETFTWFPGYGWQAALCHGCREQLGWQFSGADMPRVFFGLIADKLTTVPPDAA